MHHVYAEAERDLAKYRKWSHDPNLSIQARREAEHVARWIDGLLFQLRSERAARKQEGT